MVIDFNMKEAVKRGQAFKKCDRCDHELWEHRKQSYACSGLVIYIGREPRVAGPCLCKGFVKHPDEDKQVREEKPNAPP